MIKSEMLEAIENAKKTHLEQMHIIASALKGKKVDHPPALSKKECECGAWFYADEATMKNILGIQLFEKLDSHHEKWHQEYHHIYDLLFKEEKKTGLLSKIFKSDKIDELSLDKAKAYYRELQSSTDELMKVADATYRRLMALKESKFE